MSEIILKIENLSKQYRLGVVGTGTISHDLNRWWHMVRGKEDPFLKVGEVNDRAIKGNSEYVWALKDINIEVKKGEVLGIIGKNGAGKSTLLKILSKVTGPTTGSIKSKGRIASLLEVGTGFHPELTGKENIFLNGAILGMTKKEIKAKYDEIVDFSGCERYIDTPVKRYSSGMRVRLAFAVAAFLEPDILVIDEVLAVGDAEFQKKAIGKMQDISKGEGRTVLFVSHNMLAVRELCTRAILIKNGVINFKGTPEEVIDFYLRNEKKNIKKFNSDKRIGNGDLVIDSMDIHGKSTDDNLEVAKPMIIQFNLKNKVGATPLNSRIDLRIDDNTGQKMAWLSSEMCKSDFNEVIHKISFNLSKLNLNQGIYCVTTYIEVEGLITDWVKNAFTFEVFEGDFYGSNKKVPINQGKFLLNYRIEYNKS